MPRLVAILAVLSLGCTTSFWLPPADLVLRHGVVYVGDAQGKRAESIAIRAGTIVAVGSDTSIAEWIGPNTRVVELDGRLVLPGFHDAHVHPISGGLEALRCQLAGIDALEALEARIGACALAQSDRTWVEGGGWELPVFPDANPSKELLDALVPDRPALLRSADGHSAWANSRALERAGITRTTADPPHGRIERDAGGEPSGTLRESAIELVARAAPTPSAAELDAALRYGLAHLARQGVVCAHEANASPAYVEAYLAWAKSGAVGPRVQISLALPDGWTDYSFLPRFEEARSRAFRTTRIRADSVKLFLDGVIEARTAALLEPYEGSDERGTPNFEPDALNRLVTKLAEADFDVHMHAIGDRAVRMGLDAVEHARVTDARLGGSTIAHLELVSAEDRPRFAALRVTPNVQALWAQADPYITELTIPVIGDERSLELYPIASLFANTMYVAAGSDWPVSSANPLEAIEVGITRRAPDAPPGPGWLPEQSATLEQMLAAYTRGGAWLHYGPYDQGELAWKSPANLIVLDRNLFEIPAYEISDARVLWTIADGETIWLETPSPIEGAE